MNPFLKFKMAHKLTYRQLAALLGWSWRSCQNWTLGTHKPPQRALTALELLQASPDYAERIEAVKREVPSLQGKVKKKRR